MAYGPGQAYPPQPALPGVGRTGTGPLVNPSWLASTADRERTASVLRAGFTEGRLDRDELDERVAQAYAARTYAELWALTADLPAGPLPYPDQAPLPVGYSPLGYGPQPGAAALTGSSDVTGSWRSGAALLALALVIFTMAALVTAILTAHAQTGVVAPFTQVGTVPYQTNLLPAYRADTDGLHSEIRAPSAP